MPDFSREAFEGDLQRYEEELEGYRRDHLAEDNWLVTRVMRRIETVRRTLEYFDRAESD